MVPIEYKSDYLNQFEQGDKFNLLINFLWKKGVVEPSEISDIAHKLLYAIEKNDINIVSNELQEYTDKNPNPQSHYIYKDLNLFLLICLSKKFKLSCEWLKKYIENRQSAESEVKSMTQTFWNLLNDNLDSIDGFQEVVIVYKDIIGIEQNNESILNRVYKSLSVKYFPFYSNVLLNILALKAIDIIINTKGLSDFEKLRILINFQEKFYIRVKQISTIGYYLGIFVLLFLSCFLGYKSFFGTERESQIADKILAGFGFLTFSSVIGLIWGRKTFKLSIERLIKQFFGYPE